jgi:hypothetical protein
MSASERLFHSPVRYMLPNKAKVADSWDDLTDGNLDLAIARDETGTPISIMTLLRRPATGQQREGRRGVDGHPGQRRRLDVDLHELERGRRDRGPGRDAQPRRRQVVELPVLVRHAGAAVLHRAAGAVSAMVRRTLWLAAALAPARLYGFEQPDDRDDCESTG